MSLRRHGITLLAALFFCTFAEKAFAEVRVAVVDLQRALNETEDGRNAKNQLKRLFKRRQDALDQKQNDLKKMKDDIEKQKNVLSQKALQERVETYQKAFIELQSTYVEYQRELATKEGQLTKSILERMQQILSEIGQRDGYSLIVERNEGGVVWAPNSLDLTDEVIRRYNAAPSKSGGGASGARTKAQGRQ